MKAPSEPAAVAGVKDAGIEQNSTCLPAVDGVHSGRVYVVWVANVADVDFVAEDADDDSERAYQEYWNFG